MNSDLILFVQVVILCLCGVAVWLIASRFPCPSPLIKPFLRSQLRWPEHQIRKWIAAERIDKGFLRFFSRDPERTAPPGGALVAPADGLVIDIFQQLEMRYIVIALSFWDVHVQRSPVAGEVTRISRGGDTFMDFEWQNAAFLRDKPCPVQAIIGIRTEQGEVEVRLITSYLARRINVWVEKGARLVKGQRLGNITFGSTVVLGIPAEWPILTQKGERVVAGESMVVGAPPADAGDSAPAEPSIGQRLKAGDLR
jgi:phosphatidylserine decarboxylase